MSARSLAERVPRWLLSLLLMAVMDATATLAATGLGAPSGPPVDEYEVKAAFLYNFVKFVRWPCETTERGCGGFTIGVLGNDPFGAVLDEAIVGKRIRGNRIRVVRFSSVEEVDDDNDVHVLFVGSEQTDVRRLLDRLKGRPVLIVGESDRFASEGGHVRLFLEERRMRFEINPEAAKHRGIRLSPELLVLARIVEESQ